MRETIFVGCPCCGGFGSLCSNCGLPSDPCQCLPPEMCYDEHGDFDPDMAASIEDCHVCGGLAKIEDGLDRGLAR